MTCYTHWQWQWIQWFYCFIRNLISINYIKNEWKNFMDDNVNKEHIFQVFEDQVDYVEYLIFALWHRYCIIWLLKEISSPAKGWYFCIFFKFIFRLEEESFSLKNEIISKSCTNQLFHIYTCPLLIVDSSLSHNSPIWNPKHETRKI